MPEKLIIWTLDWVPEGPRGFVRDLRLRWAAEEAGVPYDVRTVPFEGREANHLDRQPFGQVPWYEEDGLVLFESSPPGFLHQEFSGNEFVQKAALPTFLDIAGTGGGRQFIPPKVEFSLRNGASIDQGHNRFFLPLSAAWQDYTDAGQYADQQQS